MSYILVLDVGTTNIKAHAFSMDGELLERQEERTKPIYKKPGWVEQDPEEIMDTVYKLMEKVIEKIGDPIGIALTNQRSTTTVWNKETGEPLHNMITWQDTRTQELVEEFSSKFKVRFGKTLGKIFEGLSKAMPFIKNTKRGSYLITLAHVDFGTTHSSMHLRWLMENVEEVRNAIKSGKALFGTIDTWVAWNLTGKHITDYTNASATGLFDPAYLKWSDNILDIVEVPKKILPKFGLNDEPIGTVKDYDIPLLTMVADQQASLYMSGVKRGVVNITNGTGSFIDMNVGDRIRPAGVGLYPMVALGTKNKTLYLLEGSINSTGSAIDWLIDIGFMKDYSGISEAFQETGDECKLTFLPALSGLSSPYIRPDIKGTIRDITRDTTKEDFIKSLILGIAMRCSEVIESLEKASGIKTEKIIAEGGASKSDELLQATADLSEKQISRPQFLNGSAYGTYLLAKSIHQNKNPIKEWKSPKTEKEFTPRKECYENLKESWGNVVEKIC